ncbi:hypothetical protein ACWC5G_31385, partial [Streptomyces sp. NPDC001274]
MAGGRSLGRRFGWLWSAYAVSAYGTGLGFGAFAMIAVLVLDSGPTQVAVLAAAGRAVGAVLAVPLGPWVEFRRKRPVYGAPSPPVGPPSLIHSPDVVAQSAQYAPYGA